MHDYPFYACFLLRNRRIDEDSKIVWKIMDGSSKRKKRKVELLPFLEARREYFI